MNRRCDYAIVCIDADLYRLDRLTPPGAGPAAFIKRVTDRLGQLIGWELKPLVVMLGPKSRIWTCPADAIASTKLMTPGQAKQAVAHADATTVSDNQADP